MGYIMVNKDKVEELYERCKKLELRKEDLNIHKDGLDRHIKYLSVDEVCILLVQIHDSVRVKTTEDM
jgi:hypothetical protein